MRHAERPPDLRNGFSLAEVMVALALTALLAALCFGVLAVQLRVARITAQRLMESDAVRTAATVVNGELRRVAPIDVRALAAESVALRAFRGMAVVCGSVPPGTAIVNYWGDRAPDVTKDSAVWIGSGGVRAVALSSVTPTNAACAGAGAGTPQAWRTSPPVAGSGVLLLFESGVYYLSANALRYRLGSAGRQPLTAQLFADSVIGFSWPRPGEIQYRIGLMGSPAHSVRGTVRLTADSL